MKPAKFRFAYPYARRSKMNHWLLVMAILLLALSGCTPSRDGAPRVLLFTDRGVEADQALHYLKNLGTLQNIAIDTCQLNDLLSEEILNAYAAVAFLNSPDMLRLQQSMLERYVQSGGSLILFTPPKDEIRNWPWYKQLVALLPEMRSDTSGNKTNIELARGEYDGGRYVWMDVSWKDTLAFTTSLQEMLTTAMQYAVGGNKRLNYKKAFTMLPPEPERFRKEMLVGSGLNQPVQFTILPDMSILLIGHLGDISYYHPSDSSLKKVADIAVYHSYRDKERIMDVEMGMLGIAADPDYARTGWVYLYYSPTDKVVDRLSRFRFRDGKWDMASEQVILEVPVERFYPMAHCGGGITFDKDHNLYLSTGDNSNPFFIYDSINKRNQPYNLNGFAPLDGRPGYGQMDNRRSSGNTNDLRGKILRIKPMEDGSYRIPDGNLFKADQPDARGEIYVMGTRNPYRISIDAHTGFLYWGEVGPDAREDSLETRGPKGYDEINQSKKAGNFGYPFFVGNNIPYVEYDFATGKSGKKFDPAHLVNKSFHNTGLVNLPVPQPAFIWYPYDQSIEFPILGEGGRAAMAGPVYHSSDYTGASRFPDYYDGTLFIYDWIRSWVMNVRMDASGNLLLIERFMPGKTFKSPIDMKFGPDGKLYVLEYGNGWHSNNPDAGLYVIDYQSGNLPPEVSISSDTTVGETPLKVNFTATATDRDGDVKSYKWILGADGIKETTSGVLSHVFTKPGEYLVSVEVEDNHGGIGKSVPVLIKGGNAMPDVKIQLEGNPVFYFPDRKVKYNVCVSDKEDGISGQPGFNNQHLLVHIEYLEGLDRIILAGNPQQNKPSAGALMIASLDCNSCHKLNGTSIGPSFQEVAHRYALRKDEAALLPGKIIKGSSGNWGKTMAMPAHSSLSFSDAQRITNWILSLHKTTRQEVIAPVGEIDPRKFSLTDRGAIFIQASYTDNGGKGMSPLMGYQVAVLRSPFLTIAAADVKQGFGNQRMANDTESMLVYHDISLQGVSAVQWEFGYQGNSGECEAWTVSVRQDSPEGKELVSFTAGDPGKKSLRAILPLLKVPKGRHSLYFLFSKQRSGKDRLWINGFRLLP